VLGEALLVEGLSGNLDPVLQALFEKEGLGQIDELGKSILVDDHLCSVHTATNTVRVG